MCVDTRGTGTGGTGGTGGGGGTSGPGSGSGGGGGGGGVTNNTNNTLCRTCLGLCTVRQGQVCEREVIQKAKWVDSLGFVCPSAHLRLPVCSSWRVGGHHGVQYV